MKPTSIKAYHEIREDGTLSKRMTEVLNLVRAAGRITGRAVSRAIPGGHKRLRDLADIGVIFENGTTRDPITHKEVILWSVTDQPALFPLKPKTPSRKKLEEELDYLKTQNEILLKVIKLMVEEGK